VIDAAEEKKRNFAKIMKEKNVEDIARKREKRRTAKEKEVVNRNEEGQADIFSAPILVERSEEGNAVAFQDGARVHLSNAPYFCTVPATPESTPVSQSWFRAQAGDSHFADLTSAREAGVWLYPSNLVEKSRCAAFRKLWEEGMYLGQGIKFGGEFLVYPGDPLRYHSHFVTTTMAHPDRVIRPMELVAFGRLGTATKKAHLICCYDENAQDEAEKENGDDGILIDIKEDAISDSDAGKRRKKGLVECYSLEWGNFG
jgi:tRNA-splicing endonuclease subunit Sen34